MPLTDAQRAAFMAVRANFGGPVSHGTAESVEQRARRPAPEHLPPDITLRIEIAPPSPNPDPTLESACALKAPERVPIYFYTHSGEETKINSDSDPESDTRVIFFIHGGGNVFGHPTHDFFLQYFVALLRVAAKARSAGGAPKCVLVAPSYRLATIPENTFPAGAQDVLAAYDYVLGKGYQSSNIIVAGDSAGGNHAIVLTHLLLQSDRPSPHGLVAIAPFSIADVNQLSEHAKDLAERDTIGLSSLVGATSVYIGDSGLPPAHPLISGSFLPSSSAWPRTLILVGSADTGIDAAHELDRRIAALGRPVELVEYDERPHGFWALPHIFPEDIQDSAERIARFLLD